MRYTAKRLDIKGMRFGMLTALEMVGSNKYKQIIWKCVCECGNENDVVATNLKNGRTRSCGCMKKNKTKHGHTKYGGIITPEYSSWRSMISRCTNPNITNYEYYGGRGITVCERWRNSFENFFEDMGSRPSLRHTIDRIDNDGNYEPGNCKWATKREQRINQRLSIRNKSGYKGIDLHKRDNLWRVRITINGSSKLIGYFKSIENAVRARNDAEEKYSKNKEGVSI